jgi:hypothetical protein
LTTFPQANRSVSARHAWKLRGLIGSLSLFGLSIAAASIGCSRPANRWLERRPPTFSASGVVTLDGTAVEGAFVAFDSLQHNLTAVGRTDAQGRFVLKTFQPGDGLVVGDHRVRVEKREVTKYNAEGLPLGEVNRLPERYAGKTSGLSATSEPKSGNSFQFELVSERPIGQ